MLNEHQNKRVILPNLNIPPPQKKNSLRQYSFRFIISRCPIWILARALSIVQGVMVCHNQKSNARTTWNQATTDFFHTLSNSLYTDHPMIWHGETELLGALLNEPPISISDTRLDVCSYQYWQAGICRITMAAITSWMLTVRPPLHHNPLTKQIKFTANLFPDKFE